jgi:hypothetical protein
LTPHEIYKKKKNQNEKNSKSPIKKKNLFLNQKIFGNLTMLKKMKNKKSSSPKANQKFAFKGITLCNQKRK